jgi:hypothetical protein
MRFPFILLALAGCDFGAEDGDVLVATMAADQPESPELGVIVDLHVRTTDEEARLRLRATAGEVRSTAGEDARCLALTKDEARVLPLVILPDDSECLLEASIVTGVDDATTCEGEVEHQILVPLRATSENPTPDAAVDVDAAADAEGGSDAL